MTINTEDDLIEHDCPVEGCIMIEKGKSCNWCDEIVEQSEDETDVCTK